MWCIRLIFLVYLTVLLAWFLPAHTRGRITMVAHETAPASCCAEGSDDTPPIPAQPSQRDKANCAVCFWAAGILPEVPVAFEARPVDLALIETRQALDQCSRWFIPTDAFPRGPPAENG